MKKRLTMFLAGLLLCVSGAFAQTQVNGTVLSQEDGQPIIGAAIKIVGKQVGMLTDVNGRFSLTLPAGSSQITVSYVGYESQTLQAKNGMRIFMKPDSKMVDEVIVVAFGKAKRSSFTGSAANISSDKIADRQVTNVTQALKGEVSGVQVTQPSGKPGEAATIRIRGIGSMASSNAPLYVVDGVPYDGDISAINTADIESISVLKDAASNALYGARGANGVVLVTTKRGATDQAEVTFEARLGHDSRALSNYELMDSPFTYYEKAYSSIYNSVVGKKGTETAELANAFANQALLTNKNGGVGYQIFTVPEGQQLIGADGKINPNATLGYNDGKYLYKPDDWFDELYNKSNLRQEYNLSVSGRSERVNYFVSGGYLNDEGIIDNSGFERYTARGKIDFQAKSWLKLTSNVAFTHYESDYAVTDKDDWNSTSSANIFYYANFMSPIYPLYIRDANGNIMTDSRGFTMYDYGDKKGVPGYKFGRTFMNGGNPASSGQLDRNEYISDVVSGRWAAEIDLYKGLKFTYNLGLDIDNQSRNTLYNAFYGQYSSQGGVVSKYSYRTFGLNNQQLLTYNNKFGKHSIEALAGHETYSWKRSTLWGNKNMLYNPTMIELDNAIKTPATGSSSNEYSTEGWLGRIQYGYDDKYIASASYRRDASSRFHKDNRWGNFGSLGAAWVISKEEFMQDYNSWLNFLKFKVSYGIQGNDHLLSQDGYTVYYPYEDTYVVANNNDQFAVSMTNKGNKDITWETSYSFNTGFDFNLWDGKLNGTIEYYNRTTKDLLYYMPVPASNGYSVFPTNVGRVRNYGFEIDLNSTVYKNDNIKVDVYANATTLKNKIIELAPELKGEMISGSSIYREGESMYQYYMRNYAGVYNGDATELAEGVTAELGQALYYIDVKDEQGNVTGMKKTNNWANATRYAQGDRLPDFYGGFGVKVAAYGVDFSVSAAYQLGGKCFDSGYQSLMHTGTANSAGTAWHKDILNAWTAENTATDVPRLNASDNYANSTSDRFIISSNYLDITNIALGYTFPKNLISKLYLNNVRVYVTADNVALFAKRKGLDPRQSFGSSTNMQYSAVRTVSGGISVKF